MRLVIDFIRERNGLGRNSWKGSLKLFDRIQLQTLVNIKDKNARTAKESMQIAKKQQNQQMHCVTHVLPALLRSLIRLLFCCHWAFHPIE